MSAIELQDAHPSDSFVALSALASKVQQITAQDFKIHSQITKGTFCGVRRGTMPIFGIGESKKTVFSSVTVLGVPRICTTSLSGCNNTIAVHPACAMDKSGACAFNHCICASETTEF